MKNIIALVLFSLFYQKSLAQGDKITNPFVNVRLSILLFPTTPLLTIESRTISSFTVQFESNFVSTHGINIKYYFDEKMNKSYVFSGIAFVENELLRTDREATLLPYAGYGYAYRFGNNGNWTFDSRIGVGPTLNADTNGVYPVIKTGIGKIF